MKFFLVIVSAFVVLTVDGRDLPDDYGGRATVETENPNPTLPDFKTSEDAYPFISNPAPGYMAQRKAGSKCEAQDMCIIMGGTCVNNASLCQGRLLPGCKGKNCKCCVYGNLEIMIHNLEQEMQTIKDNLNSELQHLKDNLTDSNSKLNEEFDHLKDDLTDANSNLSDEFETLKDNLEEEFENLENNLTNANSNLNEDFGNLKDDLTDANSILSDEFGTLKDNLEDKIKNLEDNLTNANLNLNEEFENVKDNLEDEFDTLKGEITDGNSKISKEFESINDNLSKSFSNMQTKIESMMAGCPEGFFYTKGSNQCYKFFIDVKRTWIDAKKKCQAEGLELAEPNNPISLRLYLTETYATNEWRYCWLGALGTGTDFKFERSGKHISKSDPLWAPGQPGGIATNHCLLLLPEKTHWLPKYPKQPYYVWGCTSQAWTVCEYIRN